LLGYCLDDDPAEPRLVGPANNSFHKTYVAFVWFLRIVINGDIATTDSFVRKSQSTAVRADR
jgi:hypothetical protein